MGEQGFVRQRLQIAATDAPVVVEDDTHEVAVNVQAAIVVNEAQLPQLVHEETHPRPCCPDHFGQRFLTYPGNDELVLPFFAEAGQQQQDPSQPFLTGIEKLINQVLFDPSIPGQQVRHEEL